MKLAAAFIVLTAVLGLSKAHAEEASEWGSLEGFDEIQAREEKPEEPQMKSASQELLDQIPDVETAVAEESIPLPQAVPEPKETAREKKEKQALQKFYAKEKAKKLAKKKDKDKKRSLASKPKKSKKKIATKRSSSKLQRNVASARGGLAMALPKKRQ